MEFTMAKFIATIEIEITDEELEIMGGRDTILEGGLIRQINKRLEDDRFEATIRNSTFVEVVNFGTDLYEV
jgi:hypothetical protein